MIFQFVAVAFFLGFAQIHAQDNSTSTADDNNSTSTAQDSSDSFTQSPADQKVTDDCNKRFPGATYMSGSDYVCATSCYGENSTDDMYYYKNKDDGTNCGTGKICFNGICQNSDSVNTCKKSMPGSILQSVGDSDCSVTCNGDGNPYLMTVMLKPNGTVCELSYFDYDFDLVVYNGTCSSGQCLSNSTLPFDDEDGEDE